MDTKLGWELAFPQREGDAWKVVAAIGTVCRTRDEADVLLSDRVANGDAFPGEFIRRYEDAGRA